MKTKWQNLKDYQLAIAGGSPVPFRLRRQAATLDLASMEAAARDYGMHPALTTLSPKDFDYLFNLKYREQ